ncbi:amidohydrolase [bacterium]|nr:amidohydrolase [bacterium]
MNRKKISLLILVLLFTLFHARFLEAENRDADLILVNGNFYTGDPDRPAAEMLAVRGGRILAVGYNDEAERFQGPRTVRLDLEGHFACAGFNDAHLHMLSGGQSLGELDLSGVRSAEEMRIRVREHIRTQPAASWIIGRGWDQGLFPDGKWPTRALLDSIAPHLPVYLVRTCGHAALVNGNALRTAGIDRNTPDPPAGEIMRFPGTSEPNGILKEEAMGLVSRHMPVSSGDAVFQAVQSALDHVGRFGITSVQDNSDPAVLEAYSRLLKAGRLTCRISFWPMLGAGMEQARILRESLRHPMLRLGVLKGFLDGSMGARTAAFLESYSDDAGNFGIPQMPQDRINAMVLQADREGFQIALHAIGDSAVRMGLEAYSLARRAGGREDRHRLEHAQVVSEQDMPGFRDIGVIPSMQPAHLIWDMAWAGDRIGPQRSAGAYAWKSLLEQSGHLAFGSDWPVVPVNPLIGIYAAVTRCDTLGQPAGGWHPEQRLTAGQAIEAYTLGSAYAEFMETEKGTLEPGKWADITVLDRDLLNAGPEEILRARVIYTIVGGNVVFRNQ